MAEAPMPRLSMAAAITGWNSERLAEICGIGASTVRAYQSGRLPEYLNATQLRNLRLELALFRDQVAAAVETFELLS